MSKSNRKIVKDLKVRKTPRRLFIEVTQGSGYRSKISLPDYTVGECELNELIVRLLQEQIK